jgi:uncharacterized SAM-binding protein YcdF (DUF218 family)
MAQPQSYGLSRKSYVTPFKLILFALLTLFFAVILIWKRARIGLALSTLALFWLLSAGWLSAPLLALAQPRTQTLEPALFGARNAIVLLGGGTEYDGQHVLVPPRDVMARIAVSARRYTECARREAAACVVIVSGGNPQRHPVAEADTYLPYLLREGVPRAAIVIENRSRTTYENARYVADIVRRADYDSLTLVTSAYQMPRALLDFERFGMRPQPLIANARHAQLGIAPRYDNLVNAETALHELIGIAQFHVYRAIGWF